MSAAAIAAPVAALVGNPNAGKTSLFNALTGARQKVGNYPGVTVERRAGRLTLPDGRAVELIDLPGAYSLTPRSPDEAVTRAVVLGEAAGEKRPDAIVAVVDATNLPNHLRFVLELRRLGLPMVVALNMADLAERDGTVIDVAELSTILGLPVIPTVAVRRRGLDALTAEIAPALARAAPPPPGGGRRLAEGERVGVVSTKPNLAAAEPPPSRAAPRGASLAAPFQGEETATDIRLLQREARAIADAVVTQRGEAKRWTQRFDGVALHPLAGPVLLAAILFLMFQSVFAWAEAPMGWIEAGIGWLGGQVAAALPDNALRSLLVDGVLAGVGAVVVFLPQIVILFLFIILLEQSGYMVRAAFIMDRLMARVGLNGRAFIPLLSSFACAIPGIMATRTIDDPKDRLTTILIAPLMTCSARLPVYAVIIAAFIPATRVGPVGLQGLVLFGLYGFGVLGALAAAWALRRTVTRGATPSFLIEMPKYQWPVARDVAIGLTQRAGAFLKRAGGLILGITIVLWVLASYPRPPAGDPTPPLAYSAAGRIGAAIEPLVRPIGFNREIAIALVPGLAAREVAVAALGTVYALQGDEDEVATSLVDRLRGQWSLATALAFLAWYVFAPQCLATLAVVRRETGGWRWPAFMFGYLLALAYVAAGLTYWTARALL